MPPRTRYYILRALLAVLVGTSIGLLLHSCTPETVRQQQEATFEMPTIAFEEFELGNGLTVLLHQDNSRPLVAVGVWYRTGSSYEWRGRTGLAHLFEHLMFNGSKGYPQDYFEGLEDAGVTDINGTTNRDRTNYFQTVPKDALDRVLWLESDRMGWMLVDEERLRQQVGVVHNEKRQRENVPYGTVWAHLGKLLYGGEHPYSWPVIGFEPDLAALTMDDIQRFRSAWYMPNNAILVLAGDFDLDDARAKITSYFGPIPPGVSAPPPTAAPTPLTENRRQSIGDTVPHPRIYRSWLAPSVQNVEQTAALYLACKMLGGSERSILHRRLVLEDRLANYAVCYSNFGALSGEISLIVEPRNEADMELVESIVEETLADFLSAPPDATELHRLVQAEIGSTLRGIDKLGGFSGRLTRLAEGTALAANPRLWEEELRAIEAMDPQTLQQVATTWLQKPWAQISVLVGEEAAPPLSPYSAGGDFKPDALPELEVPVDRPPLPQLGPHSLPVLPAVEQWLITNHCDEDNPDCDPVQMPLYLIHRAGTPLVSLDLQFECMRPDDHQPAGLSDFAAHMMSQGTEAYSLIELDELSSELAATVSPYANLDYCGVSGSAPAWNMQKTLELVKELAFKPRFDEKAMVREQARWLSSIEREYSDPRNLSLRLLPPLLYGDYHPYGVPMTGTGYKVEISALVPDQLRSWHKHVFSPGQGQPDHGRRLDRRAQEATVATAAPTLRQRGRTGAGSAARGERRLPAAATHSGESRAAHHSGAGTGARQPVSDRHRAIAVAPQSGERHGQPRGRLHARRPGVGQPRFWRQHHGAPGQLVARGEGLELQLLQPHLRPERHPGAVQFHPGAGRQDGGCGARDHGFGARLHGRQAAVQGGVAVCARQSGAQTARLFGIAE